MCSAYDAGMAWNDGNDPAHLPFAEDRRAVSLTAMTSQPTPSGATTAIVPDAGAGNWVDRLAPASWRPFLRLVRFDRPIGAWLLLFPCWWGQALAEVSVGRTHPSVWLLAPTWGTALGLPSGEEGEAAPGGRPVAGESARGLAARTAA